MIVKNLAGSHRNNIVNTEDEKRKSLKGANSENHLLYDYTKHRLTNNHRNNNYLPNNNYLILEWFNDLTRYNHNTDYLKFSFHNILPVFYYNHGEYIIPFHLPLLIKI